MDGDVDEDGYYECPSCEGCGTVEKSVVYDNDQQEELTLSQTMYAATAVKSKKELLMAKWSSAWHIWP